MESQDQNGKDLAENIQEILTNTMDRLDLIAEEAARCLDCKLFESRKRSVPGHYTIEALRQPIKIMFVGEGPGAMENETGQAFVGKAGEELNEMLAKIDLSRRNVFILNTVKCRPPNNRAPTHEEMFLCAYHMFRQIAFIKPDLIVAMGGSAIYALIQDKQTNFKPSRDHKVMSVGAARHRVYDITIPSIDGIPEWQCKAIATYHPAGWMRSAERKEEAIKDFKMIGNYIDIIREKKMGF